MHFRQLGQAAFKDVNSCFLIAHKGDGMFFIII